MTATTPAGKPVEHLRSVLVAIGTLPARDEQLTRLQRWITDTIAQRRNADEQQLLRRYAIWHVLRRLRGRLNGADTTHHQFTAAKRSVQAAVTLLDWLTSRGRTLSTARQGDLDAWLAGDKATGRDAGNFIRWANRNKLTNLELPATRWGGPTGVIDTEAAGNEPATCCTRTPSTRRTASPACSCCSTPNSPPPWPA